MTQQAFAQAWPSLRRWMEKRGNRYAPQETVEASVYRTLHYLLRRVEEIEADRLHLLAFWIFNRSLRHYWAKSQRAGRPGVRIEPLLLEHGGKTFEHPALAQRAIDAHQAQERQQEIAADVQALLQSAGKPSDRVLLHLLAQGMTQSEAAQKMGVTRQAVSFRLDKIRQRNADL